MADVAFVVLTVVLFVVVVALVAKGVERLSSVDNVIGLLIGGALIVYLIVALVFAGAGSDVSTTIAGIIQIRVLVVALALRSVRSATT